MENELANAIFDDDLYSVYTIINAHPNLNTIDETGMSPLMHAVGAEDIRLIELFITRGADINLQGHQGFTALHHAVDISIDGTIQNGGKPGDEPLSIISFLIENGANLSALTDEGETPFDIANNYGAHKVVRYLSEAKP